MNFLPPDYDLEKALKRCAPPYRHPDFDTHAHYLEFVCKSSMNIVLKCGLNLRKKITLDKKVKQKVKLLELTVDNLKIEKENIDKYPEYSVVCVSWIPVKSYYLFFNLLIILEYLITGSDSYLAVSHANSNKYFKTLLIKKHLTFDKGLFNKTCTVREATEWKIPPGENVKKRKFDPKLRYKSVIRKLLDYHKEEFRRIKKTERIAGTKKQEFERTTLINLCDFFHLYRIKANYRDMEFIDKGVDVQEFNNFYNNYYQLTMNFYHAFKKCINEVSTIRTSKLLLK